ncbi:MAG: phosphopentomutase [Bacilli bacterium]|nr:phosphopentomutase [Bacilli bacterium]
MKFKRIFLIVLDSLGVGEAIDAKKFDDEGCNTLGHILENVDIKYPNLEKMGFLNLVNKSNIEKTDSYYTKAHPKANGKDTLTGHLELMGIRTLIPFKTFTKDGFPKELIDELESRSGRKVIGNCNASGTEIIERLGQEQMETGALIVYTSADSVLQIAAHEEIIPLDELYKICEIARELTLKEEWKVGRIIARPYIGTPGNFTRTSNRHDYALDPVSDTVLDNLKNNGYDVISIGKIADVFNNCGITKSTKTKDNLDGILKIIDTLKDEFTGLCFANLNDFDSKYGHRRNIIGYAEAIKEFDNLLPQIKEGLNSDDLLIITADHGNDPSYKGTDHTRENIPVLIYSKNFKDPKHLKELDCFTDIGATIADNFNVELPEVGKSFLGKLN